jgi:hypothetical protein
LSDIVLLKSFVVKIIIFLTISSPGISIYK